MGLAFWTELDLTGVCFYHRRRHRLAYCYGVGRGAQGCQDGLVWSLKCLTLVVSPNLGSRDFLSPSRSGIFSAPHTEGIKLF